VCATRAAAIVGLNSNATPHCTAPVPQQVHNLLQLSRIESSSFNGDVVVSRLTSHETARRVAAALTRATAAATLTTDCTHARTHVSTTTPVVTRDTRPRARDVTTCPSSDIFRPIVERIACESIEESINYEI